MGTSWNQSRCTLFRPAEDGKFGIAGEGEFFGVNKAYWCTHLPMRDIAEAFDLTAPLVRNHIVPALSDLLCVECASPRVVRSRTEYCQLYEQHCRAIRRGFAFLCQPCYDAEEDASIDAFQQRMHEIDQMPYQEYLATAEWKQHAARARDKAGNRCQLCNADDTTLHVHHRTYENRGREMAGDLIVLCEDCHAKFHDKLPQPRQG